MLQCSQPALTLHNYSEIIDFRFDDAKNEKIIEICF